MVSRQQAQAALIVLPDSRALTAQLQQNFQEIANPKQADRLPKITAALVAAQTTHGLSSDDIGELGQAILEADYLDVGHVLTCLENHPLAWVVSALQVRSELDDDLDPTQGDISLSIILEAMEATDFPADQPWNDTDMNALLSEIAMHRYTFERHDALYQKQIVSDHEVFVRTGKERSTQVTCYRKARRAVGAIE